MLNSVVIKNIYTILLTSISICELRTCSRLTNWLIGANYSQIGYVIDGTNMTDICCQKLLN